MWAIASADRTCGRASLGGTDCQLGRTFADPWTKPLHPTSSRARHHNSQRSTQSTLVTGHSVAWSSICRNPLSLCKRTPPKLRVSINTEGSHANQQVSKVEEEGDNDREEGAAGADQDEVGCKHLVGGVRYCQKTFRDRIVRCFKCHFQ